MHARTDAWTYTPCAGFVYAKSYVEKRPELLVKGANASKVQAKPETSGL